MRNNNNIFVLLIFTVYLFGTILFSGFSSAYPSIFSNLNNLIALVLAIASLSFSGTSSSVNPSNQTAPGSKSSSNISSQVVGEYTRIVNRIHDPFCPHLTHGAFQTWCIEMTRCCNMNVVSHIIPYGLRAGDTSVPLQSFQPRV